MLRHAAVIVIAGIGASGLVAQIFALGKLLKIGINAVVERMRALLATVRALAEDLLLASYSGAAAS